MFGLLEITALRVAFSTAFRGTADRRQGTVRGSSLMVCRHAPAVFVGLHNIATLATSTVALIIMIFVIPFVRSKKLDLTKNC